MASGSNWERDTAKFLTYWLTGQWLEYYFWRSPGSGSIATSTGLNPDLHGDIIPLKPEAEVLCSKFVLECKSGYPKTSLDHHLKYNKKDWIKEFWEQVNNDAEKTNKYPMLIYKKKGFATPWVGVNPFCFEQLENNLSQARFVHVRYETELDDVYFFEMKEFFNNINKDTIYYLKEREGQCTD